MTPCFFLVALLALVPAPIIAAPAQELIQLDTSLTQALEQKQKGRLDADRYELFKTQLLGDLKMVMSKVAPTRENKDLNERILVRLGIALDMDRDHREALKTRLNKGRALYAMQDYPAVLAEAEAVLKLDPTNKDALALKYSSKGRANPSGDKNVPPNKIAAIEAAAQRKALPMQESRKINVAGEAPPEIVNEATSTPAKQNSPAWPLPAAAGAAGVAAIAYGATRKREDEKTPVWKKVAKVGVAVVVIASVVYVFRGPLLVAAASAGQFLTQQGQRVAQLIQSEAGAINPQTVYRAEQAAERIIARYGPANPGPLEAEVVQSFRSGTYVEKILDEGAIFYRVYGGKAGQLARYWTRVKPNGPLQAIIDNALFSKTGNTAQKIVTIRVPPGTKIFEGVTAAQEGLVGGGNQIYLETINPAWIIK